MHSANSFVIRLRNVTGERTEIDHRLQQINEGGVPNYFGEQRFGFDGNNLQQADQLLARLNQQHTQRRRGRRQQHGGIYLSAARSHLFNQVLAQRVIDGIWSSTLVDEAEPTGPLWGRGRNPAVNSVRELEERVLADWQDWRLGLEHSGLQQERRALVLKPEKLQWQWLDNDLELSLVLPPGSYATVVLREIMQLNTYSATAVPSTAVL